MMLLTTQTAKAMFGHVAAERERRIETQQQLTTQETANEHLHVAISVLSAGAVIMLITGAAVGSKTRRDHDL